MEKCKGAKKRVSTDMSTKSTTKEPDPQKASMSTPTKRLASTATRKKKLDPQKPSIVSAPTQKPASTALRKKKPDPRKTSIMSTPSKKPDFTAMSTKNPGTGKSSVATPTKEPATSSTIRIKNVNKTSKSRLTSQKSKKVPTGTSRHLKVLKKKPEISVATDMKRKRGRPSGPNEQMKAKRQDLKRKFVEAARTINSKNLTVREYIQVLQMNGCLRLHCNYQNVLKVFGSEDRPPTQFMADAMEHALRDDKFTLTSAAIRSAEKRTVLEKQKAEVKKFLQQHHQNVKGLSQADERPDAPSKGNEEAIKAGTDDEVKVLTEDYGENQTFEVCKGTIKEEEEEEDSNSHQPSVKGTSSKTLAIPGSMCNFFEKSQTSSNLSMSSSLLAYYSVQIEIFNAKSDSEMAKVLHRAYNDIQSTDKGPLIMRLPENFDKNKAVTETRFYLSTY